jgi:hypothetical protein
MEFKQRVKHIGEIIEEVQWQDVDPDMLTRFVCLFYAPGSSPTSIPNYHSL